ncbi:Uncharacterised protein [Orientia tsutsugamushi str. Gilliam]|uniref:Uncharacterized protein n=1 Tax=Orientia tsutsugamushi str. Gilliam TaxID=1359184 RepID=A0A2U3R1L1_ORITS|nr:transporter substrate-binding domain-containing protein [Orientia tsutsugamushi]SPR07072.1 Uncharacterised protein [Orientia tsutsugamushi str. Gilliam]
MLHYKSTLFILLLLCLLAFTQNQGYAQLQLERFNLRLGIESESISNTDIAIASEIAAKMHVSLFLKHVPADQKLNALSDGVVDIISSSKIPPDIKEYAYLSSIPHRYENYSLFVLGEKNLEFSDSSEFVDLIKFHGFRLGVMKNYVYKDNEISKLIQSPDNQDIIFEYETNDEALKALLNNEIDGWITITSSGVASVVQCYHAINRIKHIVITNKVPVYFMFNKKTLPIGLITDLKREIEKFEAKTVKSRIYLFLLIESIHSSWFYGLSIIAGILFTLPSIILALTNNSSLFSIIMLALLPASFSNIALDIIMHKQSQGVFSNPIYIYCNLVIVLIGFFLVRLLGLQSSKIKCNQNFLSYLFVICDALVQSIFMIVGIIVSLMIPMYPIMLWGPVFVLLFSSIGCIVRSVLCRYNAIQDVYSEINFMVIVIWTIIFLNCLDYQYNELNLEKMQYDIVIAILGVFITSIAIHYLLWKKRLLNNKFCNWASFR